MKDIQKISQLINKLRGTNPSRCLVSPSDLQWLASHVVTLGAGKMIECGVARGGTLALCHKVNPELNIIGIDSWDVILGDVLKNGVTEKDDQSRCRKWVGDRSVCGTVADVYETYKMINSSTENLKLIKGYFTDSIPPNLHLFDDIDVLRLDCDFYEPITFCLEMLYDKVKQGGIIILDDWHFNPTGVRLATYEFLARKNVKVQILRAPGAKPDHGGVHFFKPVIYENS